MRLPVVACLFVTAFLLTPSWATDISRQRAADERFSLFDGCRPLNVLVRPLETAAKHLGVSDRALQVAAEGALRAAGIYDPAAHNALGVFVHVAGPAFHVEIEYLRVLQDPQWHLSGHAITWQAGTNGVHGGNPNHVLATLHRHLGRFVDAFRRVNAEACNQAR